MGIETKTTIHLTLTNGTELKLSKAEAAELRDALTAELGDGMLQKILRDPDTFKVPCNPWPYPGISPNTAPYSYPHITWQQSNESCQSFAGTHIHTPRTYDFRGLSTSVSAASLPAGMSTVFTLPASAENQESACAPA